MLLKLVRSMVFVPLEDPPAHGGQETESKTPMNPTTRMKKLIAAGLIGATALGSAAVVPAIAEAQEVDTEEQADRQERRADRQERRTDRRSALVEALGVTVEELIDARQADQSFADIAADQGVSLDAVVDAIVTQRTERLAEAVAEGRITQEQADERLANLEERVAERLNTAPSERPERTERTGRGQRGGR